MLNLHLKLIAALGLERNQLLKKLRFDHVLRNAFVYMYVCVCSYISVCACVHVEIIGLWDILYSHTKDKEEKLTDVKKKR